MAVRMVSAVQQAFQALLALPLMDLRYLSLIRQTI
jgi:hypothetical protein